MIDQQLGEHCLELASDRERLIYHLLALLTATTESDLAARERASTCLARLGYPPDGDRARRMLGLGQPPTPRRIETDVGHAIDVALPCETLSPDDLHCGECDDLVARCECN